MAKELMHLIGVYLEDAIDEIEVYAIVNSHWLKFVRGNGHLDRKKLNVCVGDDGMTAAAPFSFAMAALKSATNAGAHPPWMYAISNNSASQVVFGDAGGGPGAPIIQIANQTGVLSFAQDFAVGAFSTLVGTVASATSLTGYHFNSAGVSEVATSASITLSSITNTYPTFYDIGNAAYPNTTASSIQGSCFTGTIFYGAACLRRRQQKEGGVNGQETERFLLHRKPSVRGQVDARADPGRR